MAATTATQEKIGNHFYGWNKTEIKSGIDQVIDYTEKGLGAYRCIKAMGDTSKAAAMVLRDLGYKEAKSFEGFAAFMGTGAAALTFPRIPRVLVDATTAIGGWGKPTGGPERSVTRSYYEGVNKVGDAVSTCSFALSLVQDNPVFRHVADVTSFATDSTSACMEGQTYTLAKKYEGLAQSPELKKRFGETKTEALLKIAKAVCAAASGILALLALAFSGFILPAAVRLVISLATTLFAIASYFYRENCEYEKVKFFEGNSSPVWVN